MVRTYYLQFRIKMDQFIVDVVNGQIAIEERPIIQLYVLQSIATHRYDKEVVLASDVTYPMMFSQNFANHVVCFIHRTSCFSK